MIFFSIISYNLITQLTNQKQNTTRWESHTGKNGNTLLEKNYDPKSCTIGILYGWNAQDIFFGFVLIIVVLMTTAINDIEFISDLFQNSQMRKNCSRIIRVFSDWSKIFMYVSRLLETSPINLLNLSWLIPPMDNPRGSCDFCATM